jgi:hypothetical protein
MDYGNLAAKDSAYKILPIQYDSFLPGIPGKRTG